MKERYEKYIAHNQEQLNIALRGIEACQKELDKLDEYKSSLVKYKSSEA